MNKRPKSSNSNKKPTSSADYEILKEGLFEYRDQLSSYDNSELITKLEALKSKKNSK
ncbi:hypothetical protein G6Z16_11580 [Clostridium perfringens]|uniref:hypothetical protein n=1 Tax=Clostridium perfringens TaxID=1502 RepID=UPI0013E3A67C|nr:hypothetical protein [Clostridium perfringens]NGT67517.1 hypothetical protein [Clostridium perfringens]